MFAAAGPHMRCSAKLTRDVEALFGHSGSHGGLKAHSRLGAGGQEAAHYELVQPLLVRAPVPLTCSPQAGFLRSGSCSAPVGGEHMSGKAIHPWHVCMANNSTPGSSARASSCGCRSHLGHTSSPGRDHTGPCVVHGMAAAVSSWPWHGRLCHQGQHSTRGTHRLGGASWGDCEDTLCHCDPRGIPVISIHTVPRCRSAQHTQLV